jgi:hypothetical protein
VVDASPDLFPGDAGRVLPLASQSAIILRRSSCLEFQFLRCKSPVLRTNNSKVQKRISELFNSGENFDAIVFPNHEIKETVAQVGWLTSAYLLSFYALGYRYILHNSLEPIQKCILDSFENPSDVKIPDNENIGVINCGNHYCMLLCRRSM